MITNHGFWHFFYAILFNCTQSISKFKWLALAMMVSIQSLSVFANESIPPVIIPVSLNEPGEIVNLRIKIIDHHIYYFGLRFSFDQKNSADRARVRLLTGGYETDKSGKPIDAGVSTPVLLTVTRVDGDNRTEIYQKEVDPLLTSWGDDNFKKQIGLSELSPGIYKVNIVLQRAAPSFNGTPVAFSIGYDKFKVNFKPSK